ncbi:MAG: rod-binding protein [Bdellovibrio sp.]
MSRIDPKLSGSYPQLESRQTDTPRAELSSNALDPRVRAKFEEAGSLYEKQFLRELVRAMRSSVSESSLIPKSQAEKIFQEQLDQQWVEAWGDRGGVGFGEMITQKLIEQYGQRMRTGKK